MYMNEEENKNIEQHYQSTEFTVQKGYCVQCGAELTSDQAFYPKCGHKKGEGVEVSWTYHLDNGLEVMDSLTY